MKKTLSKLVFMALMGVSTPVMAQDFGFGGQQLSAENMHYSEKFADINYADDGQAYHTLDIYLPEKKQDKYPVVMHIYGSAWFNNNGKGQADLGTICAALLKAGYAVVCPNHRASTEARWPAQCHDIKAALRFIRGNAERFHLDTKFVAVSGFSSGGHLAAMMGATTGTKTAKVGNIDVDLEGNLGAYTNASSTVDAVIDWSGPIDMRRMDCAGKRDIETTPEEVLLGAKMEGNDDLYRTLSPMTYLDKKDAPTVIFHGKKDNVVPFCQGHEYYNSLLDNGVQVRFYQEEEGGHGFKMYTEQNLNNMTEFLAKVRKEKKDNDMSRQNPIVQTCYTTDPAPLVSGDRLYVYTGHDENNADFFWMQEWRCYSTNDMVNWTDHGSPAALETFSWADDRAWAPQCIERNGKFYLYVPAHCKTSGTMAIGVCVSDSPTGPFVDPIGKPLADGSWDFIDPTVLIDDDGQAWLYWGNPKLYYAKLNDDMISFVDGVHQMDMSTLPGYTEGPWIMKRQVPVMKKGKVTKKTRGQYYLMYACGGIPERISYAVGNSPVGPWEYKGDIMPLTDTGSFTNHAGLMDFRGHSYFFYHTGKLPGGGGFARSVAVEEFKYNADGTLPTIPMTEEGVKAIATFNPYAKVEAATMAQSKGLTTQQFGDGNVYVSDIHNGDWMMLRNVDFGNVALNRAMKSFTVSAASALRGGTIELRADSREGDIIASIDITGTNGWENFKEFTTQNVNLPQGIHDLFLVFKGRKGPELFTLDWWELK